MMLGLRRRYRAFLVVAAIFTFSLFYLQRVPKWDKQPVGVDPLQNLGEHVDPTSSLLPLTTSAAAFERPWAPPADPDPGAPRPLPEPLVPAQNDQSTGDSEDSPDDSSADRPSAPPEKYRVKPEEIISDKFEYHGLGRLEIDKQSAFLERPHWEPQEEHFPIPLDEIITLPSDPPKKIPTIQHKFDTDTKDEKKRKEQRLEVIKDAFQHAWSGYKKFAMPHDELVPIEGDFKDPFNGWGATLVDTLDTLWIMDLKDEFEEAVEMVAKIDFTTSMRKDIPLFETVIRYLGGLIAAYDLSSAQYPVLLEKALQLANILMGAFDTPNRMPITYYNWAPSYASQPHRASANVVLAELGSLSLEFTRLAQITRDDKYYDAVARITNGLEIWQNNTKLPGLWPAVVDASGCKKPDRMSPQDVDSAPASDDPRIGRPPIHEVATHIAREAGGEVVTRQGLKLAPLDNRQTDDAAALNGGDSPQPAPDPPRGTTKSDSRLNTVPDGKHSDVDEMDCQFQGLASPPHQRMEKFTLGGRADSTYEYLPKEWLLLGGLNDQYKSMYINAAAAAKTELIYRPMTKTERDILFVGARRTKRPSIGQSEPDLSEGIFDFEGEHLTCFAGGMFALGAKIFGIDVDLEIARKLTDGCVWAYESTATRIMPESFQLVPCDSEEICAWNETKWWESLDPNRASREAQATAWQEQQKYSAQLGPIVEGEETKVPSSLPADEELVEKRGSSMRYDREVKRSHSRDKLRNRQVLDSREGHAGRTPTEPTRTHSESFEDESGKVIAGSSDASVPISKPRAIASHEEYVQSRIQEERLPEGFSQITSKKYILRPEAIESVFIMYRVTGDKYWQDQGWKMFNAIQSATLTEHANSAITDVTRKFTPYLDSMESFWLAETLKYFYLLYSDPDLISLDDYVLNTEAHPFKRPR